MVKATKINIARIFFKKQKKLGVDVDLMSSDSYKIIIFKKY